MRLIFTLLTIIMFSIVAISCNKKVKQAPDSIKNFGTLSGKFIRIETQISRIFPALGDFNADGSLDLFPLENLDGVFSPISLNERGLQSIFSSGRHNRDIRLADYNGDGLLDIISNTYSAFTEEGSFARLYFNIGNGHFRESMDFAQKRIRGRGETIVVADFDNDSDIDIFLPYYTHDSEQERCYLLENDGLGSFTDVAERAGVSLKNRPKNLRVEGAQAVDINWDGKIDLYAAGHLFINQGSMKFLDKRNEYGLPNRFDEGIKFFDWDNDGDFDFVLHDPDSGPHLYEMNHNSYRYKPVFQSFDHEFSYGINVEDVNGDSWLDVITATGKINLTPKGKNPTFYINQKVNFKKHNLSQLENLSFDINAFGDFNDDKIMDWVVRDYRDGLVIFLNALQQINSHFLVLRLLGYDRQKNQQGRAIKVYHKDYPDVIYSRVIESGSGYLTQNQYDILIRVPKEGIYVVLARLADGPVSYKVYADAKYELHADGTASLF